MKTRTLHTTTLFLCAAMAALTSCQTIDAREISLGKDDYYAKDGQLWKDDDTMALQAIAVPDLASRGSELSVMVPALARIAEHGGDTVAFNLFGFDESGRDLDRDAFRVVRDYCERAKEQRMRVIVDVLGDSTDERFRSRAVRAAADELKREGRALYLIDGPDAGDLAAKFKHYAPNLCVASPEGPDVYVVDALPAEPDPAKAYLVVGSIPEDWSHSFLLDNDDASYTALFDAQIPEASHYAYEPDQLLLTEAERTEGFVSLFNGKDMNNWWFWGDNPNGFRVTEYGFIEWVEEGASAIMTAKKYDDFVLRLDYKILPGGNSGVFIRAPRAARQSKIGMEFQIHGDHGVEPSDDSTGAIYTVVPAKANTSRPGGEWNNLEIMCHDNILKASLNGEVIQHVNLDDYEELKYRLRNGYIGLQDHSDYVAWRNIRIKEL